LSECVFLLELLLHAVIAKIGVAIKDTNMMFLLFIID
jgi:hypothetical protein